MRNYEQKSADEELWLKYFRETSEKRNSRMFLIILTVAALLLVTDVLFNNYPGYLSVIRLIVTVLGFLSYLLFRLKKISGNQMVLLYVIPAVITASYMTASQSDVNGLVQASTVLIIFGFVTVSLIILPPGKWLIISAAALISYILMSVFLGAFSLQTYLVNNGTLILLCFIGFPYVALVRYRLFKNNFMLQNEITFYANNDVLTGSFNRRGGIKHLEQSILLAERNGQKLSICFIDVNGLKKVNDEYGHNKGDELLRSLVSVIRERIRKSDTIFRYGGDEFIIIFPDCGEEESLRIIKKIQSGAEHNNNDFSLSFSFGIAEYSSEFSIDDFIRLADDRMYIDKKSV